MGSRFTISSLLSYKSRQEHQYVPDAPSADPPAPWSAHPPRRSSATWLRRFWMVLCAALAWIVPACETIVDVEAPRHDPQLVVHGFFSSDSLWAARVSHSVAYTSRSDPNAIDEADVSVIGPDGTIQILSRRDSGLYVGTGLRPEQNEVYRLRASAPGFSAAEGSAVLPAKPSVSDFKATSTTDRGGRRVIDIEFTLDDPPATLNHYGVFVVQSRWRLDTKSGTVTPMIPALFTFESDDPVFETSSEPDFLGDEIRYYRDPFFTDRDFDGTARKIWFRIRFQDPNPTADTQIWRGFALVVVSTSEDLYAYWTSANRQLTTGQNPFAEPIHVHSNMSNGFGIFGAFQYRILPVPVAHLGLSAVCDIGTRWRSVCDSIGEPTGFSTSLPVYTNFLNGAITR